MSLAKAHDWSDTHHWCGQLVEEMHRGEPVGRGVVIAVKVDDNGTHYVSVLPSSVMAMPEHEREHDTTQPSVSIASDFRPIPTLTATNPRGLGPEAWELTDHHGCKHYIEPFDNSSDVRLSADDAIAVIRTRCIGDWQFTARKLICPA